MLSKIKSMSLDGLNGYLVEIQSDVAGGLPNFEIVGLPDIRVKEAKERVRTAIKNSNIDFQSRKIIVNLAPSDKRKEGTHLDLPIAIGILIAMGEIRKIKIENFESTIFLGELSLDGSINWVNGILPMCIEAKNLGIKRVILPTENVMEASFVKDLDIIPVSNLLDVIKYLKDANIMQSMIFEDDTNATMFLQCILSGDLPKIIPYSKILEVWMKNQELNNVNFGVSSCYLELILSVMYRNPNNMTEKFAKIASNKDVSDYDYAAGSIRQICQYNSTFSALTFEDIDSMITTSLNRSRDKIKENPSPVEQIIKY